MKKTIIAFLFLLGGRLANAQCNTAAPVTHYITQTAPGEIYRPNGSAWKGGDTVKIKGNNYTCLLYTSRCV